MTWVDVFWNNLWLSENKETGKYNSIGNLPSTIVQGMSLPLAIALEARFGREAVNKHLDVIIKNTEAANNSNRINVKYDKFIAKTWEVAGKINHPVSQSILQKIQQYGDDIDINNKMLGFAKSLSLLNHFGNFLSVADLALAIHSDDANAVAKSGTAILVGMLAGTGFAALGTPLLLTIGLGIIIINGITAVWDKLDIGGRLGLMGESFSDYAYRALEPVFEFIDKQIDNIVELFKEVVNGVTEAIDKLVDIVAEYIEKFSEDLDKLLDIVAEYINEILDFIQNELDEILDAAEVFFEGVQDISANLYGFGLHLWDELTDSNTLEDYLGINRTGEFHVVNPDPLTLDLDGDGIEMTAIEGLNSTLFDHNKDGIRTATGWVSADDGLLVLDRNGDGVINHGGELFGDNTLLKDGSLAANGFAALAEFDENGDGKIDAQDAVFEQLKVWRDLNQDGISQAEELFTLEQLGIQSLDLNHQAVNQRQGNGNSVARLGSYTDSEGKEHLMGDLLFDSNPMISRFTDKIALSAEQQQAPNLRGMGRLRDLQEAAAKSSDLAETL